MGQSIDALLKEADDLIMKKTASVKKAPAVDSVNGDHEAVKIANLLLSEDDDLREALAIEKKASKEDITQEETLIEKIASALVINEVLLEFDKFEKIAKFEEKAAAEGYSQDEINAFVIENLL